MSDHFACPNCGTTYTREKRRIGKPVVCSCGRKFLVPAADFDAASGDDIEVPLPEKGRPASPSSTASPRNAPRRPPVQRPSASDSSGEVLPLADVVEPARTPPSGSWAEPPGAQPLPQAEIVYEAEPYSDPVAEDDDLFSPGGAYAEPVEVSGSARTRRPAKTNREISPGLSHTARIVLFVLLPIVGAVTLVGLMAYFYLDFGPRPAATNQPDPSGYPITIWNAVKNSQSDDFSLEYRVDRSPLETASDYFWVVKAAQTEIEFPIPAGSWKARGTLSGKLKAPANLPPPYTTHIEERSGAKRNRASNETPVVVGG